MRAWEAVRLAIAFVLITPAAWAAEPAQVFLEQLRGAVMGAPLPLGESMLIAWPQTVSLIAGTIVLFVVGYVIFQRQEVRA